MTADDGAELVQKDCDPVLVPILMAQKKGVIAFKRNLKTFVSGLQKINFSAFFQK